VTVADSSTVQQAWGALKHSSSAQMKARRAQLTMELTAVTKNSGKDLHMYTSRSKALQTELATAGQPMEENQVILYALRRLPDEFKMIKTVLLVVPHLLRWEPVMTALLPLEAVYHEAIPKDEGTSAAAYMAGKPTRKDRCRSITCWNCQKKGHYQSEYRSARAEEGDDGKGGESTETKSFVFMVTGGELATVGIAKGGTPTGLAHASSTVVTNIANATIFLHSGASRHVMKNKMAF